MESPAKMEYLDGLVHPDRLVFPVDHQQFVVHQRNRLASHALPEKVDHQGLPAMLEIPVSQVRQEEMVIKVLLVRKDLLDRPEKMASPEAMVHLANRDDLQHHHLRFQVNPVLLVKMVHRGYPAKKVRVDVMDKKDNQEIGDRQVRKVRTVRMAILEKADLPASLELRASVASARNIVHWMVVSFSKMELDDAKQMIRSFCSYYLSAFNKRSLFVHKSLMC